MSAPSNQRGMPPKVVVFAQLSHLTSDAQQYYWSNGWWVFDKKLATKMGPAEADRLIRGFADQPVAPMTRESTYGTEAHS